MAYVCAVFVWEDGLRDGEAVCPDVEWFVSGLGDVIKDEDFVFAFGFEFVEVFYAFEFWVSRLFCGVVHEFEEGVPGDVFDWI